MIASLVRRRPTRKTVWIFGSALQAAALVGMAAVACTLTGRSAGACILGLLGLFSLARGLNSVSSKDVIGKTVPKTRRGRLTGFTTSVSGVLTLGLGSLLAATVKGDPSAEVLAVILAVGAILWLTAAGIFWTIREVPGATEGGADALTEALARLKLLRKDRAFRRFVWVRSLFVSTALAGPFYVTLARRYTGGGDLLAMFILASGLATAMSSAIWGRFSDRSSRSVLVVAGAAASTLGLLAAVLDWAGVIAAFAWIAPVGFFLLSIAHSGVRIGRKTYLLDLGSGVRRTDYVAVSNTVIGVVLVLGGALGLLAQVVGPGGMLLILSVLGFGGVLGGRQLPET
jgi:uncharacterized membrane protein